MNQIIRRSKHKDIYVENSKIKLNETFFSLSYLMII